MDGSCAGSRAVVLSILLLPFAACHPSAALAEDAPTTNPSLDELRKWADVKEWTGQISYNFHYSWDEPWGPGTRSGQSDEHGAIHFHLNKIHITKYGVEWRGDGQTSASASLRDVLEQPKLRVTTTFERAGTFAQVNNWLDMEFDKKIFNAGSGGGKSQPYTTTDVSEAVGGTRSGTRKGTWSPMSARVVEGEPLPAPQPGMGLSGSDTISGKPLIGRGGDNTSVVRVGNSTGRLNVQWDFTPVWDDIELVVDIDDYDKWIPQANREGIIPGNYLTVHATLKTRDGKPLHFQAKRIRFEMKDTSKEPGVAMNWPPKPAEKELPDLQFDPTKNQNMELVDPEFQIIATPEGKCEKATAVIGCYDWGAWTDLRVTAELPDGRTVVGHLKDHDDQTTVLIPKRHDYSFIADAWKDQNPRRGDAFGADDSDDADNDHVQGNFHDGDGFSLYEEYRGFYVNFKHVRLDPNKKDLFIVDQVGGQTVRGFATFQNGTGIVPHYQLRRFEMRDDRAMDFNRSDRTPVAYKQLQHGLVMGMNDNPVASMIMTDTDDRGPTVPKYVEAVTLSQSISPLTGRVDSFMRNGGIVINDVTGSVIAHELSHACSVTHHGSGDLMFRQWKRDTSVTPHVIREFPMDDYGNVDSSGVGEPIIVLWEGSTVADTVEMLPDNPIFDSPTRVYVAVSKDGQHSGDEACYMRYKCAAAYVHRRHPNWRVIVHDGEINGSTLCDSNTGTGVNAAGRKPWPRYGDTKEGKCKEKVNCVDGSVP
jgi:hypothetical protein